MLTLLVGATASCGADPAPDRAQGSLDHESTGARPASGGAAVTGVAGSVTLVGTGGQAAAGAQHAGSGGATAPVASAAGGSGEAHPNTGGAPQGNGGAVAACEDPTLEFAERCHACASDDCGHCVCSQCAAAAEECESREGCAEIAACVLDTGCEGAACFCGTADTLRCLAGEARGPCKDVILNAPGGRSPTAFDQSGGPAADAAVALGSCTEPPAGACSAECS